MREKERERESTRVQLRSVPFRTVPRTEPIPYLLFLPSCNGLHDLIRAAHLACAQFSIDVSFSFSLLSFPSFPSFTILSLSFVLSFSVSDYYYHLRMQSICVRRREQLSSSLQIYFQSQPESFAFIVGRSLLCLVVSNETK